MLRSLGLATIVAGTLGLVSANNTVDLGYAIHEPSYNVTGDYYSFRNIRYADPPARFSKPVAPTTVHREINNGSIARVCPQAYPWWLTEQLATQYNFPPLQMEEYMYYLYASAVSEDCLFLDVAVPRSIFDKRSTTEAQKHGAGAAVLVWIYGGGYTSGTKEDPHFNPSGLLLQSLQNQQEGVLFVKLNYRLGLFGWLADGDGVTKNAGLWDQRLALEWIQTYIHLFGGNPDRVTVIGESAGGGSILHHITAYGGSKGFAPFRQAIPQSATYTMSPNNTRGYDLALRVASNLNGTSIITAGQLRSLSSTVLIEVNKKVVNQSDFGQFTFGPAIDDDYVPDLPSFLLGQGRFDHSLNIISGYNLRDSANFTPSVADDGQFREQLKVLIYNISDSAVDYIATEVYPNDLSGVHGYTTQMQRYTALTQEQVFACHSRYLARASHSQTHNYLFTYPPAVHQQDISFTFFNGDERDSSIPGTVVDPAVAVDMQRRITRFAQTGDPNIPFHPPAWPEYGTDSVDYNFGDPALGVTLQDPSVSSRCGYWQSGAWRN